MGSKNTFFYFFLKEYKNPLKIPQETYIKIINTFEIMKTFLKISHKIFLFFAIFYSASLI